ncbi:hypothetical protein ONZ43_g2256 [Nemania bipapillata]|uniref:Uncharacterized protein n=1 Tax=Nemania bipapillata TaxID=110536 RepID=A0ACC2J1F0_9PEZI|nr:hypothetical protein ONZ43_g2256 [Nemania bipapillata]
MLSLFSTFDYHGVPLVLLQKDKETETKFRAALGALQAFSLVTVGRGKDAIAKMHRLVALSTQQWLEMNGGLDYWRSEAIRSLASKFPGPGRQEFAAWTLYEALVPHVHCLFAHHYTATDDILQVAQLQISVGLYDLSRGRYSEAFDLCSKSLEIRQQLLSQDDPLLLESVQTLGEALLHRGELQEALAMLKTAAAGREKVLGIRNPDTLESLSDLTIIGLELDNLEMAESTGTRALEGRRDALGEHHLDTLLQRKRHSKGFLILEKFYMAKSILTL